MSFPTSVEPVKATLSTSGWQPTPRRLFAVAGHDIDTPSGNPASHDQLAKAQRRERRLLGRLQDDGAAGRLDAGPASRPP